MAKSNGTYNASKKNQATTANQSTSTSKSSKTTKNTSDKTLDCLLKKGLKDIYSAEKQLIDALPEMAKAADSEDLQDAFNKHLQQTKRQAERIEKIFDRLEIDKDDDEVKCEIIESLIKEANETIEEFDKSPLRDSALIIGAQKVEHYEIASYGSLRELADALHYPKIAEILDRTLQEEEETDKHLSCIAQDVNDECCEATYENEGEIA